MRPNYPSFVDVDQARQLAHKLYPNAKSIRLIEHSYDNIVALIDDMYAVRFPRDNNAYMRSQYETHILKVLENTRIVTIPRVYQTNQAPPYLVTSFVQGRHLSPKDINEFSLPEQIALGADIATFAYAMHQAFSLNEELRLRKRLGLDELKEEPWPLHFEKTVYKQKFAIPEQDAMAKDYYAKWKELCDVPPTIVVHDDLHTENILFDNNRVSGILDFGDTNVGTPEQELRQLYRINSTVLTSAITTYSDLSGLQLSEQAAITWAVMQELAVYAEQLANDKTDHYTFARACRNLNAWLPEVKWPTPAAK